MLLSPFSSPRRLVLLVVFVFFASLMLIRSSQYSTYLPKYDLPSFSSNGGQTQTPPRPPTPPQPPGSAEEQQQQEKQQEQQQQGQQQWSDVGTGAPSKPLETAAGGWEHTQAQPPPTHTHAPTAAVPLPHASYEETQDRILHFIQWDRPNTPGHWPGWDDYIDKDYDPNRWEGLDWDTAFYTENGVERLQDQHLSPTPYRPYPAYNSAAWRKLWNGTFAVCQGARGRDLDMANAADIVEAYPRRPAGFPNMSVGSAAALGLDETACFDRDSRYRPYGSDTDKDTSEGLDWTSVWWGKLQDACLARNKDRYAPAARDAMVLQPSRRLPDQHDVWEEAPHGATSFDQDAGPKHHARTAVVIRTWEGYSYTDNDVQVIRSLVTELSLLSGGEYQLYLLVNVKEREADIYDNPQVYQDVLRRVVPRELRDISVLWTEAVCEQWYPKVGDWQVYWMQFMPLQWFSKTHPEFDYIWNWETDARYTGNPYHFLEQVQAFARSMPRKHLWERNSRFYLPAAHGDFDVYLADTDAAIANATAAGTLTPVWGPLPYAPTQTPIGPAPPTSQDDDDFSWGVGEDADLITLQPIWDPSHTEWSYRHKIWNYEQGIRPVFSSSDPVAEAFFHPGYQDIPRRVFINTVARFSKRMLHAMHVENLAGRSMQAEMWPATVALHHGLKAVYAPHPIWTDRHWPAWYMDAVFNANGGKTARWGQQLDSPYNHDREANFRGWSWYYATSFPSVLYRRWLGWAAGDDGLGMLGGADFEDEGVSLGDGQVVGGHGKMCLPGMLLHPVKKVQESA